ncbi:MAG TPA: tyrosine-type recombinase/integrase [Phycisphaerae bacterium]|nr:tyrosine-type recombinase/integrase [Phycisphaerae bacterium]
MEGPLRFFPLDRISELEAEIAARLHVGSLWDRRDVIAVALGLHGLRIGEVCNARIEDFRPDHRRLFVRTLKGGRTRDLTLHDSVVTALIQWRALVTRYLERRSPWLLCSYRGNRLNPQRAQELATTIFRRLGQPAGRPDGLTFHALRHTFGMWLYRETRDIVLVKTKLGHCSVQTTEEYYVKNLSDIPEQCQVRLNGNLLPAAGDIPGCQLRLFNPAAG